MSSALTTRGARQGETLRMNKPSASLFDITLTRKNFKNSVISFMMEACSKCLGTGEDVD